jgi:hypothetical protein
MRFLILAAVAGAVALPATAANAQYYGGNYRYGYGNNYRGDRVAQEQRECQRELRRADSRREYQRELRECRREIAAARRDQYGYGNRYGNRYNDGYYNDGGRYWDGYRWRVRY